MSRVIIDIKDKSKEKTFISFLKSIPFIVVQEKVKETKKDYDNFKAIFGIWKGRDINLNEIRSKAWDRK